MSTASAPELASLKLCARWLGVPRKWLLAEAQAGRIPCIHAGGDDYICDVAAVEQSLLARARQLPAQKGAERAD
jgi:hypothetical protein